MAFTNIISGTIGGNGNIIYTNYSSKSNLQVRYDGTGDWLECSENANITGKSNCSFELKLKDGETLTTMQDMFWDCSSLTSLDLSHLDTSSVTNMQSVFNNCSSLTSLNVSNFNTSQVTTMNSMFYNCSSLISLDLSSFNTSQVTNMLTMFYDCTKLTSLDLSNFDTSNVINMYNMFFHCSLSDIGLLYATSTTINSLLTLLETHIARNIYYTDAPLDELTVQNNITYIKYESSQATFPYTLNKLPNGVADYIDVVNKVHVQRVGKIVLDGTLSYTKQHTNGNYTLFVYDVPNLPTNTSARLDNMICDKLIVENYINLQAKDSEFVTMRNGNSTQLLFCLSNNKASEVLTLQTYLASNPIKVLYELATPIYTPLTEEEIAQLPLSAYKDGYVNLSSDQLMPSFEFRMRASNRYQVDMLETGYYYLNAPVGGVKLGTANVDVQQMPCIVKVGNVGTGDSGYRLGLVNDIQLFDRDFNSTFGKWLELSNGELMGVNNPEDAYTDYIEVSPTSRITVTSSSDASGLNKINVVQYDKDKTFISGVTSPGESLTISVNLNVRTKYIRVSYRVPESSYNSGINTINIKQSFTPITLAKLPSHRIPTSFTQGMKCGTDFGYWEGIKSARPSLFKTVDRATWNHIEVSEIEGGSGVVLNRIEYNNTIVEDEFDIATGKLTKRIGKTFIGYDEINSVSTMSTDGNTYYCYSGDFNNYFPNWKSRGAFSVSNIKGYDGHRQITPAPVDVEFFMSYIIGFNFKINYGWDNKKKVLLNEMRRTGGFTVLYELQVPEISYIPLSSNQVKTVANTALQCAHHNGYLNPQIKPSHLTYPVPSLVGNRTYTVIHNRKNISGSTKPIELNLGGTVVQLNDASSKTLVKTPSTLAHSNLIFIGGESTVDHVMVLDGDWTNKPIEYFENMMGHDTDAIITIIGNGQINDVEEQYLW